MKGEIPGREITSTPSGTVQPTLFLVVYIKGSHCIDIPDL
jgi:hypothetical protein